MLFSNYSLHIAKDECIDRKLALSVLLSSFDGAIFSYLSILTDMVQFKKQN